MDKVDASASQSDIAYDNSPIGTIEFDVKKAPLDNEGYVQSFTYDDAAGILQFFEEYGFVVVRDVLDKQAIEATIEEIWGEIERLSKGEVRFCSASWCNKHNVPMLDPLDALIHITLYRFLVMIRELGVLANGHPSVSTKDCWVAILVVAEWLLQTG